MKTSFRLVMQAALLAIFLTLQSSAQIKIELALQQPLIVYDCQLSGIVSSRIIITESLADDFYGDSGPKQMTYDLYVKLPDGFRFYSMQGVTPKWDVLTSKDLQKSNVYPTYLDIADDGGYEDNVIILRGLEVKNTLEVTQLTFSNLNIGVSGIPGPIIDGKTLYAKFVKIDGTPDPSRASNMIRNISQTTWTELETNITGPSFEYYEGPAEGIVVAAQPYNAKSHDVQQGITSTTASNPNDDEYTYTQPTLVWVDCANAYTLIPPDPVLQGHSDPIEVEITLNESTTNGGQFWTSTSSGPTYDGAVQTVELYPTTSILWNNGRLTLTFSIDRPGTYTVTAEATNLTAGTYGSTHGISSVQTTTDFTVAQRLLSWDMTDYPRFGHATVMPDEDHYYAPVMAAKALQQNAVTLFVAPSTGMTPSLAARARFEISRDPLYVGTDYEVNPTPSSEIPDVAWAWSNHSATWGATTEAFIVTVDEKYNPPDFFAFGYVMTVMYQDGTTGLLRDIDQDDPVYYYDPRYAPAAQTMEDNALPVELVAFGGQMRNDVVTLKWTTATETNNYGFDVERSFDRAAWTKVGFVQGNGTTSSQHDYRFEDRLTAADLQHAAISYRLRQIDRDGKTEHSQVVTLSVAPTAEKVTMLQNYPNPFNPTTNISFYLPTSDVVTLVVYNELGVEVARVYDNAALDSGWHTTSFRAGSLPSGLYAYRLQTGAGSVARTMVVAK